MSRSLEQWLTHQTQAHPQAIDLGLERPREVLRRLRWSQPRVPVVTVAGTNGKGSVSTYCSTVLRAAGCRVGTFTSPHLRNYRERIRVHDRLANEHELVTAFEQIEGACAGTQAGRRAITLTYFEYNALAAFLIFEAAGLDYWVLEVGMGGRLDAVNLVDASVAVVVSIGLDHQAFLGDTVDEIAREKAGVFRASRPAVLGSRTIPSTLYAAALHVGSVPKRLGIEFDYTRRPDGDWDFQGRRWELKGLPPPALRGETQYDNAATALAALEELEASISDSAIARGLESAQLAGRFQVIDAAAGGPQWILDVAHNPDSARVLAANLRAAPISGKCLAVCGILADKDARAIAALLRDSFDAWWLVSTAGDRGLAAAELASRLAGALFEKREAVAAIHLAVDVADGCAAAARYAKHGDRVVVFGSFHTVGPAFDWLESQGLLPREARPEYTGHHD